MSTQLGAVDMTCYHNHSAYLPIPCFKLITGASKQCTPTRHHQHSINCTKAVILLRLPRLPEDNGHRTQQQPDVAIATRRSSSQSSQVAEERSGTPPTICGDRQEYKWRKPHGDRQEPESTSQRARAREARVREARAREAQGTNPGTNK